MTRGEALQVLGLAAEAGPNEIREAHHRLLLKLHPDLGGSDYLASQINRARDVLLAE
jgi:curved DNA-binding protein CbpA